MKFWVLIILFGFVFATTKAESEIVNSFLEEFLPTPLRSKWESLNDEERSDIIDAFHRFGLNSTEIGKEIRLKHPELALVVVTQMAPYEAKAAKLCLNGQIFITDVIGTLRNVKSATDLKVAAQHLTELWENLGKKPKKGVTKHFPEIPQFIQSAEFQRYLL